MSDSNVSRRDFIQKAALFTGAGLAVGGAAAIGKELWDSNQDAAKEMESLKTAMGDSADQIALLQQSLAAAEAELAKLRPDYAESLSKNAELQNALAGKQQEADSLRAALDLAQKRVSVLAQLVGLYEKLEGGDFDRLLSDGLAAAAASFAGALGLLPLLSDGMRLARALLESFENQFPAFRAGLNWLKQHLDNITASINSVEKAIEQALATLDPVTSRINQLVSYILKYLPGNIGAAVQGALDAISLLYQSLPNVVSGAHDQVISMLSEPFGESDKSLSRTLIHPIREKALAPAEKMAVQIKGVNETYLKTLHEPAKRALDQRAAVAKEIADFRAANSM